MILRIFKSIQPVGLFMVIVTGMLFWLKAFLWPESVPFSFDTESTLIYGPVQKFFAGRGIFSAIPALALSLVIGFLLVRLNTTYFFINQRSYLPALFFLSGTGIFVSLQRFNPVLVASFFLIVVIDRIFKTYKHTGTSFRYFDAGLLIGIGSLFYFNISFYLLLTWIALSILRPFIWREWIVPLFGFLTPHLFTVAFYFLLEGDTGSYFLNIADAIARSSPEVSWNLYTIIFFCYLGFLILICSIHMIVGFTGKKIVSRKYLTFMLWIFILTLLLYFLIPSASLEMIIILFIPLSYLFTHFFVSVRSAWVGDLIFTLYLAGIAVVQIF